MHQPIPQQGRWLQQVVTGYFNYHAVPTVRGARGNSRPYRDSDRRAVKVALLTRSGHRA
jgi:hypothetical protein